MRKRNKYNIKIDDLKPGFHNFSFTADNAFFEEFENSEISKANVKIKVDLEKFTKGLKLVFKLSGEVYVQCDRCLDFFNLPVTHEAILHVRYGDENSDVTDADEEITLSRTESYLNLKPHIFDYINLSLPIKIVHPKDKNGKVLCNKDMIEKIQEYSEISKKETTDPRWEKLKSLMN